MTKHELVVKVDLLNQEIVLKHLNLLGRLIEVIDDAEINADEHTASKYLTELAEIVREG